MSSVDLKCVGKKEESTNEWRRKGTRWGERRSTTTKKKTQVGFGLDEEAKKDIVAALKVSACSKGRRRRYRRKGRKGGRDGGEEEPSPSPLGANRPASRDKKSKGEKICFLFIRLLVV